MLYGLNYSPQAAQLLRSGAIALDRFKCPDWDDLIAEARALAPVYVHFPILIGGGRVQTLDLARIDHLLRTTETPYVNTHLYPQIIDFPDLGLTDVDDLTPAQVERVLTQIHADLEFMVRQFGHERILVENVPYRAVGEKNLRLSVEPATFRQVLETFDVGLLFDLSHAQIAAEHLGVDARAYILQYPLERIRELHVTGLGVVDGVTVDHLHMQDADWEMLDWFLDQLADRQAPSPWIMTFEYGGITDKFSWRSDPERMRVDVPRMVERLRRFDARPVT